MGVRHITFQLEARLTGKAKGFFSSKPKGKLERKSYQDGGERLKIKVGNLKLQDGDDITVRVDEKELAVISVKNGRAKFDEEYDDASLFPPLEAGETVSVSAGGNVVLSGELYVD